MANNEPSKIGEVGKIEQMYNDESFLVVDRDGNVKRSEKQKTYPLATKSENGLQSMEDREKRLYFESPELKTIARKIATFSQTNTIWFCDSILFQYNSYGISSIFNLSVLNSSNISVDFGVDVISKKQYVSGAIAYVLITKTENQYDVYITGSYYSIYQKSVCIAQAGNSYFKLIDDKTNYDIANIVAEYTFEI